MNYEEIVEARQNADPRGMKTLIGHLVRRKTDNAWLNEIQLNAELKDSTLFCSSLLYDQEMTRKMKDGHQLQFEVESDDAGPYGLALGRGNLTTLEHYVQEHPAVLAQSGYISNVLTTMAHICEEAATADMQLLCMHPSMILVRRSDGGVMNVVHGSCYTANKNVAHIMYEQAEDSVAPEVMAGELPTEAADTYALAWLAKWLYDNASSPLGSKGLLKSALSADPAKRPASPTLLMKKMNERSASVRSLLAMVAAVVIALIGIWVYMELLPESTVVEFVEPAARDSLADVLEDTISIADLKPGDTVRLSAREQQMMREYQAKAEAIFRKRFTKEADRVLSRMYSKQQMTGDKEKFVAGSMSGASELSELQKQLSEEAGITDVRGQKLASEIIEQISQKKLEGLKSRQPGAYSGTKSGQDDE